MTTIRIAWLLTSAFYYWQPSISCLAASFPSTKIFTTKWPGFAYGLEDSFDYEVVGERKVMSVSTSATGYGNNFTYMPLSIVERLLAFKPEIIFSNSFGIWTLLSLLTKPLGGWKVVIAYEGCSPSVDFRDSPTRIALRRVMVKMADACISNSRAGETYLKEILKANPHRVFAHPYEVPSLTSLPITDNPTLFPSLVKPIFLFVGGIIPRKGLQCLLEACVILNKRGVKDYSLMIVGDGEQRQELEQFCQDNTLTEQVAWIGRVGYNELGNYFNQADVFVLPTLEDTWGVVVLEAMMLGKPIICSKMAGVSELIAEGKNGYTFDPSLPNSLADLMELFIKNLGLTVAFGTASKCLMNQYSPEAGAEFLKQVIKAINS